MGFETEKLEQLIRQAKELHQKEAKQSVFRSIFSDSTGQKLYYLCLLADRFPKLRVLERLLLPEDSDDWIPYGRVKSTDLLALAKEKREDRVRKYFETVEASKWNNRRMRKNQIEDLAKRHLAQVVRDVAQAILDNDTAIVKKHDELADCYNVLMKLRKKGRLKKAEEALQALLDGPAS